jgi:hypothetical protein
MFRTTPAVDTEQVDADASTPAELIPLSVLELDLAAPVHGWAAYLTGRDVEVTLDDIGRLSVSRDVARMLLTERSEAEAEEARKRQEIERRLIEQDQLRQAQIWGGIPADMIPIGVSPAQAMVAAEKHARPRRKSPLEHALSNEGGIVFHPLGPGTDEA